MTNFNVQDILMYIFAAFITILLIYNIFNFNALSNSTKNYEDVKHEYEELKLENLKLEKELDYVDSDGYLKKFLVERYGTSELLPQLSNSNIDSQNFEEAPEHENKNQSNTKKWLIYMGLIE